MSISALSFDFSKRTGQNAGDLKRSRREFSIPVISIGNLDDLFAYLSSAGADPELLKYQPAVTSYRQRYGVA